MMRFRVLLVMLTAVSAGQLKALPTMIRLGYVNCAACHVAPQGGGLLNAYGRFFPRRRVIEGGALSDGGNLHGALSCSILRVVRATHRLHAPRARYCIAV